MILMVRREDIVASGDGAFEVLKHQQVAGWTAVSGPHIKVCYHESLNFFFG